MRQNAAVKLDTMTNEVKQMKKLEKDFLLAWLLGMVLPAAILFTMVGLDRQNSDRSQDPTEPTELRELEIPVFPSCVSIPILSEDGKVADMELEAYLCGVVMAEMPVDFELEALKAQCVVARTYALRRLEAGTKHPGGAVCTDPACCQGYLSVYEFIERGGSQSGITKVSRAVAETAGEVLLYEGKLIDATYFSCSGGVTEDAVAVWGNDVPYLKSTSSPGEENAAYFNDSASFTPDEVEVALGVGLTGKPDRWFEPLTYTEGGGVEKISVCGELFTGVEIRKLLSLRSTNFSVSASAEEIVFYTKGYGHRVGMSQYGAEAMAVAGGTYDQILSHYYHGIIISDYQPDN